MAENTKIQWAHHTFNPWIGCTKVHLGCTNCYAEELMATRYKRVTWGNNGTRQRTKTWDDPFRWNKAAEQAGERHRVFCASLADVFEDRAEVVPWRQELWELIDATPHLDWLLLTKRPENIGAMMDRPRHNVWLGASVSNQETIDSSVPNLIRFRQLSSVLFLSVEPLVGPISFEFSVVDWVIVGGESGKHARACRIPWIEMVLHQCARDLTPCFVKQLGSKVITASQRQFMPLDRKGGNMAEWPEHLRVRQLPR